MGHGAGALFIVNRNGTVSYDVLLMNPHEGRVKIWFALHSPRREMMKRIGWFTTARGPGSFNLFHTMIQRMESGEIETKLAFVFINREVKGNAYRTRIIEMAKERGIPVIIFPSDTFMPELKERDIAAWRDEYGKGLRERISAHEMDFGVLAGYMLIFDHETCRRHTLINLHPALPDTYKGTWEEIVGQVVDNGDSSYGSTVHLCTPELDRGAPIAYDSFPLADLREHFPSREQLVKEVRARELRREAYLLMETIRLLVEGEIRVELGKLLDRKGRHIIDQISLAAKIDAMTKEG
jgi:phosphoribosylglycinamide formyltransferase-1